MANQHSFIPSEDYGEKRRVCKYCGVYEDYKELQCSKEKDDQKIKRPVKNRQTKN